MPDSAPGELIAFKRVDTVPGVEIIEAYNTGSQWGFVATMYALAMPLTWSGDVFFDRRACRSTQALFSLTSSGTLLKSLA